MKKVVAIGILILFNLNLLTQTPPALKIISYTGTVHFPWLQEPKKSPSLTLYYKGALVPCKEGGYLFTDTEKKTRFEIVITDLNKPAANTIAHLEVPKGSPYTLYTLTRTPIEGSTESFEDTWIIEKKEGYGPYSIKEDALVIVMNPHCIESATAQPWSKEGISITLPTLTFKKEAQKDDRYNRSLLASLDFKSFHNPDDIITSKQAPKSVSAFRK